MKKIVIFHFLPLEGYPPIQNLLNFLSLKNDVKLYCFTVNGTYSFTYKNERIKIIRLGIFKKTNLLSKVLLWVSYLLYNVIGTIYSIILNPNHIIYYETISAVPPLLLKFLFTKKSLYIHYHEYISEEEYSKGSIYQKIIHFLEKKNYHNAKWISHTNGNRLKMFKKDNNLVSSYNLFIMPNYPPKSWQKIKRKGFAKDYIKFVYVGYSLADETMYASEIINFVARNPENFSLSFYLFLTPNKFIKLANELKAENIFFNPSLSYDDIPKKVIDYDLGLILYKGNTLNYKYNAPNKLFEYLALNLNVIFPNEMFSCFQYVKKHSFPFVENVNFNELSKDSISNLFLNKSKFVETDYWCELVYENLYNSLKEI